MIKYNDIGEGMKDRLRGGRALNDWLWGTDVLNNSQNT